MITVSLLGGLGNQMFSYAAALSAAERLGVRLRVWKDPFATPDRPYLLDRMRVPQDLVGWRPVANIWVRRLQKYVPASRTLFLPVAAPTYQEASIYKFEPRFECVPDGAVLRGYFQSWRYFSGIEDVIRRQFQLREPLSSRAADFASQIDAAEYPVSIHIRQGDYRRPENMAMFGLLGHDYYKRAIVASSTERNATYFVFSSDDGIDLDRLLPGGLPKVVVPTSADRPWEDMHLMSRCHSNIIANSSFSWWAAWLNSHPGKIVVAPSRWLARDEQFELADLIPASWRLA